MGNASRAADYRQGVDDFLKAAAYSVDSGAEAFGKLVKDLGGNFQLAVLNVGDQAFGRVLGCEGEIKPDEKVKHPNVAESIASVRSNLGLRREF